MPWMPHLGIRVQARGPSQLSGHDLLVGAVGGLIPERRVAGQEFKEYNPVRPPICALPMPLALNHFGCYILWSSTQCV